VIELDPSRPFTAARARNEGFSALRTLSPGLRFVQFIDGDCFLVEGWLTNARAFFDQRCEVAVVCGRRREQHPETSVYNRLCDLEWDTPSGETSACGGDALIRVKALESVGGFREELIAGEEPELCVRLRDKGWKIWRLDAEMTKHDAAIERFVQWWTRAVRSGYGMTEVCFLHWRSPHGIWKKEVTRAVFWGGVLPILIVVAATLEPHLLLACLLYPLQVCRLAIAHTRLNSMRWTYALFIILVKFAEFEGFLKFQWRSMFGHSRTPIEYKDTDRI
jgi:GT2 family glycosyltransferase